MQKNQLNSGFSIISVVIVFVFLGMIAGGVVFANMLMGSASAQKLVAKIGKYDSAVHTFVTTYRTIPGDSKSLTPAGDGNGYFNDQLGACDRSTGKYINDEKYQFWAHLSASNMIEGEKYEPYSPQSCGGPDDNEWSATGNSELWPFIELNEKAMRVYGNEKGNKSPIFVDKGKNRENIQLTFTLNAADAHKFEHKFMELSNAANVIELDNINGAGNCLGGEEVVHCGGENAGYAEYTYIIKK